MKRQQQLRDAAKVGDADRVTALLNGKGSVDFNAKDDKGWTALTWAAAHDHLPVVELLVKRKADVHSRSNERTTALHVAAFRDHVLVCEFLLRAGADLNAIDNQKRSALSAFGCFTNEYRGMVAGDLKLRRAALQAAWSSGKFCTARGKLGAVVVWFVLAALVAALGFWMHRQGLFGSVDGDAGGRSPLGLQHLGSGAMFDAIAPYYDTANKVMSLNMDQAWRRVLVDELGLASFNGPRLDILDIATGTADVAIMIAGDAQRLGLGTKTAIVALDPSRGMLDYARVKVESLHLSTLVTLQVGSAEESSDLLQAGRLFDKVTISFGIRNFADRSKALRAIRRVLKDRGMSQVCILEFVTPQSGLLAPLARAFLVYAVPFLGQLVAGGGHAAEYAHLRDSILSFPSPAGFVRVMKEAGLQNCASRSVFMDVVHLFSCRGFVPGEPQQDEDEGRKAVADGQGGTDGA